MVDLPEWVNCPAACTGRLACTVHQVIGDARCDDLAKLPRWGIGMSH
jgi:hypothetical protein